ncbi:MAG: EAL domain-containing protein [Gammaproteobacteria bacterium]
MSANFGKSLHSSAEDAITVRKLGASAPPATARTLGAYAEHVVENSPEFIFAIAPDGTTLAINDAGCRFLECSREAILGANLWGVMYPGELYAQVAELNDRFARDGGVKNHEMTMRSRRGTERVLSWTSVNRVDENGELAEIIGIGSDVTALKRSREQLRETQRIASIGGWEFDLTRGRIDWSDEALAVLELDRRRVGDSFVEFMRYIHPDDRAEIDERFHASIEAHEPYDVHYRLCLPDGRVKHLSGRCRHRYNAAGEPVQSVGTVQDVTAEYEQSRRLEAALEEATRWKEYNEHVVEHSPSVIIANSPDGITTAVNEAACRVLGCEREDIIGKPLWRTLCPGAKFEQVRRMLRSYERRGRVRNLEVTIETFRGDERILSWNSVNRLDDDGELVEAVGIATDVTELKRSQVELQHLAHHDPLTGLPNRLLLGARLDHALDQALRRPVNGALLFLDLDRFKNINDSLGHPVGDALLKAAAGRLSNCVRANDTVARLSGDEFTLLLEDIPDSAAAEAVAEKVVGAFYDPFHMEGHEIVVTPSIGISIFPRDGSDIDTLLRNADSAMYEAKNNGRNGYAMYTPQLTDDALERVKLENELRRALELNELVVHYQPQINMRTGRLMGAEALLRWNHPHHGMIPPDKFIPLAEESGLIIPIGEWVLRQACLAARSWRDAGIDLPSIAVNVAAAQIRRSKLAAIAADALDAAGLPAHCLELEVTEGFIMSEVEHAIDSLDDLRELGVRLAIDDFGTGYSSLSYLKRLPIHQLKIDRSFVRDVPDDADDMAITAAVIALARSLRLDVVAEGVETEAQRAALLEHDCVCGQGFLYSRPLAADDFLAWARERS